MHIFTWLRPSVERPRHDAEDFVQDTMMQAHRVALLFERPIQSLMLNSLDLTDSRTAPLRLVTPE